MQLVHYYLILWGGNTILMFTPPSVDRTLPHLHPVTANGPAGDPAPAAGGHTAAGGAGSAVASVVVTVVVTPDAAALVTVVVTVGMVPVLSARTVGSSTGRRI